MKQLFSQYAGLKKEIYILFIGKLVTAMGSFVWPMLTFFLTTKLGLSDGTSTLLIATASVLSFPAALLGGLAAFFVYNHHPAKVFMGDTGSLALGGLIASVSIFTKMQNPVKTQ